MTPKRLCTPPQVLFCMDTFAYILTVLIPLICKRDIVTFINLNFSMTTSKIFAIAGIKAVHFSLYSFLSCLIISGLLRLVSLVKLSEEAGLQFFGPDNVAILKIRLIVISTSSLISLALINESGNFEFILYSDTNLKEVCFTRDFCSNRQTI